MGNETEADWCKTALIRKKKLKFSTGCQFGTLTGVLKGTGEFVAVLNSSVT